MLKNQEYQEYTDVGALYNQYSDLIYRYSMRLYRDENLAENVVGDTFSRYIESINEGTVVKRPRPYLLQIARNLVVDNARYSKRVAGLEAIPTNDSVSPTQRPVEDELFEHADLVGAVQNLPRSQREAIVLFSIGLSENDTARLTKQSIGGVKQSRRRAKENIKLELKDPNDI